MKILKTHVFFYIVGLIALVNILEVFNINFLYVKEVLFLFTFVFLPGFFTVKILRVKKISLWEKLPMNIGIDLSYSMFVGLCINTLLPHFAMTQPLARNPLLISLDLSIFLLL